MALADNRELIQISTQAYNHLKAVVAANKKSGLPTSGTLLASQAILSIPIPPPQQPTPTTKPVEKKSRPRKAKPVQAARAIVAA